MSVSSNDRKETRQDRSVGNIYERLDDARKKREKALETPPPANHSKRPFPKLKPPVDFPPEPGPRPSRLEWAAPILLSLAIFGLLVAYAVG